MATSRKRRGRGEGAIYQRDDGLWASSLSLGYDENGKRKRKAFYGDTKKEVQDKLQEYQRRAGNGQEPAKGTLGQYLQRWLEIVKPTIEPNTHRKYQQHCDLHISPVIGLTKLASLGAIHVEGMYPKLAQRGMSAAMRRKVGTTLTVALGQAVRLKLIAFNPALGVRKPKADKPEFQVLDPEQVGRFLAAADGERLQAFFVLALDSGARPGELLALAWPDVDFQRSQIVISKSLEEIAGHHRVKDVKTKKGRRRIDLAASTVVELNRHRARMLAEGRDVRTGPVFCNTVGRFLDLGHVHDVFKPILARAGLPFIRLYDLRHTCATLLLLADVNPKVVSERLGHSSISLTLDTYSHVLPTMQKRAAELMDLILLARPKKAAEN